MSSKLQVLDQEIATATHDGIEYICITDIARFKSPDRTGVIIGNWLRNRNTIEFLGIWEQLNNPSFKVIEFDDFKKQAGLNSFTLTPKQWIEATGAESMNAHFIAEGLPQSERLVKLNTLAHRQMRVLVEASVAVLPKRDE